MDEHSIARLRSQLSRAEVVLFTGAGFSRDARDRKGNPLPLPADLKAALWKLCFPGDPLDEHSTLGELYELAMHKNPSALRVLLEETLTVNADSIPEFYRLFFEFPWARVYTLNVDDLAPAVDRRFNLARTLRVLSATSTDAEKPRGNRPELEIVHLNGLVRAPLEQLTFSESQYAQRVANQEPWYARCVADITSRPTIFIGTELREVPLWQHLELRRRRATGGRDFRPTSVLVTPNLSASRRELLRELKIEWVPGTAESFAREVLEPLVPQAAQGLQFLEQQHLRSGRVTIPLVSQLAADRPNIETEYLLGAEPHWSDLFTHRAIQRTDDEDLYRSARGVLSGALTDTAIAVTGTAGTGKSTALMRLALRFTDEGVPVLWVDRDSQAPPSLIRSQVRGSERPLVLAIDDADLFGTQTLGLLQDLVPGRQQFLFVIALRSTKLDELSDAVRRTKQLTLLEHTVPNLTDDDIDGLIETLDRHNRLGVLKGAGPAERRRAFEAEAGRQLLVAMIEATSGRRLEEKAQDELTQLEGLPRFIYALVAVTSGSRLYLTRDEILLASGDAAEEAVAALDRLVSRHLVVAQPPDYRYRARHRVIADLVVDKLRELEQLPEVLVGLAFAAASKVDRTQPSYHRSWRLLVRVINHEFLLKLVTVQQARAVYEEIENILSFDYHYWLQRGSLEVQAGDVRLADNFLSQARSIRPDDYRIETEYAYMLMRRAYEEPHRVESRELMREGTQILEAVIASRGEVDPYAFHVLASQGLSWVRRAGLSPSDARDALEKFLDVAKAGLRHHPERPELEQLVQDLQKEYLMTVVRRGGPA